MKEKINQKVDILFFIGLGKPYRILIPIYLAKCVLVVFVASIFFAVAMFFYAEKMSKKNSILVQENIRLKEKIFSANVEKSDFKKKKISLDELSSIHSDFLSENICTLKAGYNSHVNQYEQEYLLPSIKQKLPSAINPKDKIEFSSPKITKSHEKIVVSLIVKNRDQKNILNGYLAGVLQFQNKNVIYYLSQPKEITPFIEDRNKVLISGKKIKIKNYKNIKFEFIVDKQEIEKILVFKVLYALEDKKVKEFVFDHKAMVASNQNERKKI